MNREWTKSELTKLRAFAADGRSSTYAAKRLGRGHPATRYKAMTEGIRFFSLGKRHSALQRKRYGKKA